jgi:hypothetical protein
LNYSFSTSSATEFGVKVENASGRPNHYRDAQIKRIRDRVAAKPEITFARLRADLNLETSDLRQLAREAGIELRS